MAKLSGNVERDKRNVAAPKRLGWQALTVWECEVEDEAKLSRMLRASFAITWITVSDDGICTFVAMLALGRCGATVTSTTLVRFLINTRTGL